MHDFRPRRVGELLDDGIVLAVANWRTILPVSAVVLLPIAAAYSTVASFYVRSFLDIASLQGAGSGLSDTAALSAAAGTLVLALLVYGLGFIYQVARAVFDASIYAGSEELLERRKVGLKPMLRLGFTSVLRLLLAQLLIGMLAGAAATALFIVVGIIAAVVMIASPVVGLIGLAVGYVLALFAFVVVSAVMTIAAPMVVVERDILRTVSRSFGLLRRHFWRVILVVIGVGLVAAQFESALAAPTIVREIITGVQSPGGLVPLAWGWKVFDGLAQGVAIAVVAPFTAGVALLNYLDLRARDEGMDLTIRARELLAA